MPDQYVEPIPELDPQGLGPKAAEPVNPAALQGTKSTGKKWAILVGFAAVVFLAVASVSHRGDQPAAPPAATSATPPGPVAPTTPPIPKQ